MGRGNTSKKIENTVNNQQIVNYQFLYRAYKNAKSQAERDFFYSFIHFPTFARTYLKIRDKHGIIRNFKFNNIQKLTFPIFKDNYKVIVLKYRQGGISTLTAGYYFWLTILFSLNTLVLAHTRESAQILFEIPKRFYDKMLPEIKEFLQLQTRYENKMELFFERKDTKYYVGSTENNFGRGQTIQNLHISEFAFWKSIATQNLPSLLAALPPNTGRVIIESTPNGLNHFYDYYINAKEHKNEYTPIFLPWFKHPEYVYKPWFTENDLTPEERELKQKYNLTLEQIAFRRIMQSTLGDKFLQEFPEDDESCFLLSSQSVFNQEIIKQIERVIIINKVQPEINDTIDKVFGIKAHNKIKIYVKPEPNAEYVVSVDPAGGDTQSVRTDPTAIVVLKKGTPAQVVAVFNDKINHTELSVLIVELAKYYNNALVVIERNNHGHLLLYNLENGFMANQIKYDSYKNIYRESNAKVGWLTSQKTKGIIIDNLSETFNLGGVTIPDLDILDEMKHYVEKRSISGKIITEAESGYHDDLVMALAFGLYVSQTYHSNSDFSFRFDFI